VSERIIGEERLDYIDAICLSIALMPAGKLRCDSRVWSMAWEEIAESDEGRKALGEQMHFESLTPYAPYSRELDSTLSILRRAGVLESDGPRYQFYTPDEDGKRAILENRSTVVERYRRFLEIASRVLEEKLLVKI